MSSRPRPRTTKRGQGITNPQAARIATLSRQIGVRYDAYGLTAHQAANRIDELERLARQTARPALATQRQNRTIARLQNLLGHSSNVPVLSRQDATTLIRELSRQLNRRQLLARQQEAADVTAR